MNLMDIVVIIVSIGGAVLGVSFGFIRQACLAIGLLASVLVSSIMNSKILGAASSASSRPRLMVITTLLTVLLFVDFARHLGWYFEKNTQSMTRLRLLNKILGAVIGAFSIVLAVWLMAPYIESIAPRGIAAQTQGSRILNTLDNVGLSRPDFVMSIARLVKPFGVPKLFAGNEPETQAYPASATRPSATMQAVLNRSSKSVVEITGQACGFDTTGSGFFIKPDLVVTNAHVVAGIKNVMVTSTDGSFIATPILYDPSLDLSVLKVPFAHGDPLEINTGLQASGTTVGILGHANGGSLAGRQATIAQSFIAHGYDLYNSALISRSVYALIADIRPGDSGGPVLDENGKVVGIVFGNSVSQDRVGYALNSKPVEFDILAATSGGERAVSTQACDK